MKHVCFLDNHSVLDTYSSDEYDRTPIINFTKRKDWKIIYSQLNHFKMSEMIIHYKSIHNILYHI
jgi:hypothetical protein